MTESKAAAPKAAPKTERSKVDAAVADTQHDAAMALEAQHNEKVARQNARFAELGKK